MCDSNNWKTIDALNNLKKEMEEFRPKLFAYIAHKKRLAATRDKMLSTKYDIDLKRWTNRVEKWEASPKKRSKDAKNREIFERMFPELKRQREAQDRLRRTANREHSRLGAHGTLKNI